MDGSRVGSRQTWPIPVAGRHSADQLLRLEQPRLLNTGGRGDWGRKPEQICAAALAERAGVCDTAGKGGETLLAGGCSLKRLLHAGEHGGHSFSNCCSNARKESIFCSLQAWLATSEAAFRLIFWSSCSILASSGDEKQEKCKYPAQ